jgi:fused signal recognition particle receptor
VIAEALLALVAVLVVGLIGLAARKMARGQLRGGPSPGALGTGEAPPLTEDEERELTAEAEGREPAAAPPPERPRAMREGLDRTRKGFMARLDQLLFGGGLDAGMVDELEALLVTSDIGIRTTERLLGDLRGELGRKELRDASAVRERLKTKVREIVSLPRRPLPFEHRPLVILVIGVNGAGKTTTIGKLAARFVAEGKKVVLAAGDTFRAAAVEQLEVWGQRAGATVIRGAENGDPASVVFQAVQHAEKSGADICICDTAGRLQTKVNLMEELKKVRRVMGKALPGAPHEVLLVLDATNGQNAISQARQFKEAVEVGSIALTKLDGTAKGGVVVAICDDLALPVRYVGIGEKVEDLRDFDPDEFTDALFEDGAR